MSFVNDLMSDFNAVGKGDYAFKNAGTLSTACQWGKVAAVALCVAAIVGAIFSGPVGMFVLGIAAIALYDSFKILDNIQEIADSNGGARMVGSVSNYMLTQPIQRMTRGTIFARPIAGIVK